MPSCSTGRPLGGEGPQSLGKDGVERQRNGELLPRARRPNGHGKTKSSYSYADCQGFEVEDVQDLDCERGEGNFYRVRHFLTRSPYQLRLL
jgi:hypothetical protein